jgi:hypothetical protein
MAVQGSQREETYSELESVLEAVDDKEVSYHIRNALQLMQCEDTE